MKIRRIISIKPEMVATVAFMGCAILQKGISFITTPVFTRIMSINEYGEFSVFSSWSQIFLIIVTLSLSSGVYMTGLIKNEDDKERFTSSLLGLSTAIIVVFSVLFVFIGPWFGKIMDVDYHLFYIILFDTCWVNAFQFWSRKERVENRYRKLVILTIIVSIVTPISGVALIMMNMFGSSMYARVISVILIDFIAYTPLFFDLIKKGRVLYHKEYWVYAFKFNFPLIPHYLSQIVLNQSDRLMINKMIGADKAGIYSLAYSLAMMMLIINESINKTLDPWLLKNIKYKNYKDVRNISYTLFIVVGSFNLLLIALAPEIIFIFAPREYYEAMWVIPPVASSVFFMFMYNFFADFEFYYGESKYVTVASLIGAILNVGLNYFLIPYFGFIVAGYTTLICYMVYVFCHYNFMCKVLKKYGIEEIYSLKKIVIICSIFITLVLGVTLTYNYPIARYSIIIIVLVMLIIFRKYLMQWIIKFRGMKNENVI